MIIMVISSFIAAIGSVIFIINCIIRPLSMEPPTLKQWAVCLIVSIAIIVSSVWLHSLTEYACHNGHCGYPKEDKDLYIKIQKYENRK